jgi:preprotein translocase subunit SecG
MATFIGIVLIVAAIFLVVAVLLQSGKEKGMSGAIGGASSSDTYYGKNKANSRDYILNKLTTVVAIVFAVLVIVSFVIQDDGLIKTSYQDFVNGMKETTAAETTTGQTTTSGETTTPETTTTADTTTGQ